MYQSKDKIQNLMLLAVDTICVLVSYFLAGCFWYMFYRGVTFRRMLAELSGDIETLVIAYGVIAIFFNYNEKFMQRGKLDELKSVIKMNVLFAAVISMIEFARHETSPMSRGISYSTVIINLFLMYVVHLLLKHYLLVVHRNKSSVNQMLLLTTLDRAEDILRSVAKEREWTKRITGIIIIDDNMVGQKIYDVPVVAGYDDMLEYARRQIVDEVFISVPYDTGESLYNIVMEFENMGARVHLSVEVLNRFTEFNVALGNMGDIPVITFFNNYYDYRKLAVKRLIDIAGALVGILITAVVTIFLAPPLLLESPGPLIFKQKRVGRNGRYFYMYKFRSMYMDAEERKAELMKQNEMDGLMFKMENDPRVTKVGKFIRKTSIDEFPQFFNVLKGDMSLVGTRPPTLDEFVQYKSYHKRRLSARPGITGLWQVSGRNDIDNFEDVVKLDLEYIDNWSIGLDIKILLKTVGAVFKHTGK
ncbi:MAG: sugar transferase [Roseburia sp.]|nr:sugar transferase [Roseburia sp.]